MTNYIAAIDLGTSHITGIVGVKNTDGTFSIVANETKNQLSCIRRGNIHNLKDTANHVADLVKKLESHLKGDYIDKVYIGIGGQSLRTVDHVESKDLEGAVVTEDDITALEEQCKNYKPDLALDVLDRIPTAYYLDGRREKNPAGISCKRFEAHYKLVIGRASICRNIHNSIRNQAKKEVAGIIVSPLALADAMLSKEEKELGCALVDFGAGTTSVCVYKDEDLLHLSVIPLGGNLITHDIVSSLPLTEAEAEKLKKEHGSAIVREEEENDVISTDMDSVDRKIKKNDLNAIIEGRAKEIVENVYARISEATELKALGSGIVLAGCATELKHLPELLRDKCKVKVRHSAICAGLVREPDQLTGDPVYLSAVSLMLKGTVSCVSHPVTPPPEDPSEKDDKNKNDEEKENDKGRRKKGFRLKSGEKEKSWGGFFGTIFDED
jgi:cell division protein FtsA